MTKTASASVSKLTNKAALRIAIDALNLLADEPSFKPVHPMDEVKGKLEGMIAQLDKKAAAPKKPTKVQAENELLRDHVLVVLVGQPPKTVSEIMELSKTLGDMSNQKVAALVRGLVDEGKVIRSEEKRKAYFKLAEGVEVEG